MILFDRLLHKYVATEMLYKTLFFFFALYSVFLVTNSETCTSQCNVIHKGRLVFYEEIVEDAKEFTILNRTIRISPEGSHSGTIISCLNVTSLGSENSQCNIVEGGVGQSYITLKLSSEIGKKLEYRIEVFANKKTDNTVLELTAVQVLFIVFAVIVVITLIILIANPWKKKKPKKMTLQSILDKLYSSEKEYPVYA